MNLEQHLKLHVIAENLLEQAIRLNADIKERQDKLVDIHYDVTMGNDVKDLHIAHYQKYVQGFQELKAESLRLYANTMVQLIQPTIDKTMDKNNAVVLGDLQVLKNGNIIALQGDGDE